MQIAATRVDPRCASRRPTYFGDARWDKEACQELGFDFVLVGHKTEYPKRLDDFSDLEEVLAMIGC